ncbi:glycosyltransferase family 1 protein [Falsarthrobacter nasiphocae]|uniref:D-inositol 3-phosphate glycosyltransferase n=1 Tax=Falsarthrobacter nasiphocae TaxID=189863 RepID=A0AAE3YGU9_9MICC|nr:glycosyltransferase family 1 protein [Falsarthrobacter nasiphocae]MDR6891703.1 phosphatidylinositol alpha 1,6-mannosyltransferase [Falsarthrobacter nasiphocae]
MKIAIVAESFLPHMNGVTNSVLRVLDHLRSRGDDVIVIAPDTAWVFGHALQDPTPPQGPSDAELGVPVHRLPSLPLSGYSKVRVAAGTVSRVKRILADFGPEVVHVASPFVLGWRAIQAAQELGLPTVSIYQTEVPTYAGRYGMPILEDVLWQRVREIHEASTVNLVPSTFARAQLQGLGVRRVRLWRRGVDAQRFNPARRDAALRAEIAPGGERIVGFVGRLAAEKQVEDLARLGAIPGVKLAIVGDGPLRADLERRLPNAHFAGFRSGDDLGRHVASFDVFVHPGEAETFCQTIQEAMAARVPVVAVGRGGPLDLVDPSRTGWLYAPGDLASLEAHVRDLVGDDAKRAAFADAALASVQGRTWEALGEELVGHYERAIEMNRRYLGQTARAILRLYA